MAKSKKKGTDCCEAVVSETGGYQIESIVTVDERGQLVLPKSTREKAGIRAGDRFALIAWSKDNRVCCLSLIRTDELTEMVTGFLGSLAATVSAGEA